MEDFLQAQAELVDTAEARMTRLVEEASVIHELNHPYVDALLEEPLPVMQEAVDTLFATHAATLRRQAVGSGTTLLVESLVRAAVARYRGDREGPEAMEAEIAEQVDLGFVWMPGLVHLPAEYRRRRDEYPTMAEFMPRIADYFTAVAG